MKRTCAVVIGMLLCATWQIAFAQSAAPATPAASEPLHLIPLPKEIRQRSGTFSVSSGTPIVIETSHAGEDRAAAELLAADIQATTGNKSPIETRPGLSSTPAIYLLRLGSDSALRSALVARGLSFDKSNPQGYWLDVTRERVIVAATTAQGVFYGAQTLRQLLVPEDVTRGAGGRLHVPEVSIKDWPAMEWRGVHDDISRGPVPTMDYMKKQIRTLAEYKINLFALYIEHVFDYQNNPLIAPKEASLSAAQIRELQDYARKYYVTILLEQQAFGHLHHVLKYELYSDLAETPHGHVLAPVNPKSYDLVKSLYAELLPLATGPFFHIGADETFELGQGQSKTLAQSEGLGKLYLDHIKRVYDLMQPYHKRLMFWGDIAVKYPDLLKTLPKDLIAVPWVYEALPSFDNQVKPFRDAGLDVFVAPGANNWGVPWPNLGVAFVNIRNFVRDGQKYGAIGALNTTWDDDGESLFEMTWPALVFGAAASWQQGESSPDATMADYDWAFYRNADTTFRDAILNLDQAHSLLKRAGLEEATDDAFWMEPFGQASADYVRKALPVTRDLRLAAERALEALYRSRAAAHHHPETIDALILAAMRLDALGMKVQFIQEINNFYWDAFLNQSDRDRVGRDIEEITSINGRLEDLRDNTTRLREYYTAAWNNENRPYYLPNVLVRYNNLASAYQSKIVAVRSAHTEFQNGAALAPPESLGFVMKPQ